MSNHLTDREFGNIVSGLASSTDVRRAEEHIASCPQCRETLSVLSSAVSENPADPVPGDHVREAVINHWHRVHNETVADNISAVPVKKRLIPGLAVAATIIIAISSYVFFSLNIMNGANPLTVKTAAGEVYVNDSAASGFPPLETGSVLKTGSGGSAAIVTDGYALYIGGATSITLTSNSRDDGIRFTLNGGTVVSRSSGDLFYSFKCEEYSVSPAGTEFMLNLSGEKLSVAVAQGKVLVAGSDLHVIIPSGWKWSSGNPGLLEPLDEKTSSMIASGIPEFQTDPQLRGEYKKTDNIKGESDSTASVNGEESRSDQSMKNDTGEEKNERIRFNRELREDINEMKKEQRMERNGRNRE